MTDIPVPNERGCYTVKATENWLVEIMPMMYNYRVVLTPIGQLDGWEHGWCYFGKNFVTMLRAFLAARAFDPETQSAPEGYDKALTSRR